MPISLVVMSNQRRSFSHLHVHKEFSTLQTLRRELQTEVDQTGWKILKQRREVVALVRVNGLRSVHHHFLTHATEAWTVASVRPVMN